MPGISILVFFLGTFLRKSPHPPKAPGNQSTYLFSPRTIKSNSSNHPLRTLKNRSRNTIKRKFLIPLYVGLFSFHCRSGFIGNRRSQIPLRSLAEPLGQQMIFSLKLVTQMLFSSYQRKQYVLTSLPALPERPSSPGGP